MYFVCLFKYNFHDDYKVNGDDDGDYYDNFG